MTSLYRPRGLAPTSHFIALQKSSMGYYIVLSMYYMVYYCIILCNIWYSIVYYMV
jgi:hypothetical protein